MTSMNETIADHLSAFGMALLATFACVVGSTMIVTAVIAVALAMF